MKNGCSKNLIIVVLFLFNSIISNAQKVIENYYNYNWEPRGGIEDASYYSIVTKTDSGWYRKDYFLNSKSSYTQMVGLYADMENKVKNGYFRFYYYGGKIKSEGKYVNNLKEGLWQSWYSNGMLEDSINYEKDKYINQSLSWYKNGFLKDSSNIDNEGNGIYFAWFDNGVPSEAGKYLNFKQEGKWVYYRKNGTPSSVELYHEDSLISFKYFDEAGKTQIDSVAKNATALFSNDKRKWNNYVTSNLHYPERVTIQNGNSVAVTIEATIDEDGNVIDAEVIKPYFPAFDNEALRLFKPCPKWIPAFKHNRNVREDITHTITFGY